MTKLTPAQETMRAAALSRRTLMKSAVALGAIGLAEVIPFVGAVLFAGHVADTNNRRRIALGALAAMQTDIVTDAAGDTVAFNQLGGRAAVEAVVDEFIAVVGADSRISGFFATSDLDALNGLLVEQICEATGGYCTYSGRSMCETHDGMGVSESDFDALVGDLLAALDTLGVPYALDGSAVIDPLLLALVGMEGEIVDPQVDCP